MKNTKEHTKWRFWPVSCLAFIFPINDFLLTITIPIYFFQKSITTEIISFLLVGSTITYSFSPILFYKLSNKIGRRKSIILSMVGVFFSQFIYYFTLEPMPFFFSRVIEGLFLGFFWTSLQSTISDNPVHVHNRFMAYYNFSWNLGGLTGFLIGTIILSIVAIPGIIFFLAPLLIILNIIIAIMFFQDPIKDFSENVELEIKPRKSKFNNVKTKIARIFGMQNDRDLAMYYVPIIIPVLCIVTFSLAKSIVNLLYPIKSEILGFPEYTVFLFSFFTIFCQIVTTSLVSLRTMESLKKITLLSVLILSITILIYGISTNFFSFSILFISLGLFGGFLYGIGLRFFIILNKQKNTSKFTYILESLLGIVFLFNPIIAGYIALFSLDLAFIILSILILFILALTFLYIRKIKIAIQKY